MILGFLIRLRLPHLLDTHLKPHPHHRGLSLGWLISLWITYILSRADHRKSHVRDWANKLHHCLQAVTGLTIRDVELTDDRLTLLLARLSHPETWDRIEADLWNGTCEVYSLPLERIRLDSTTSYGFHAPVEGGLMQLGHSKDHRPDLAQFKLMAAAAEPTGQLIATTSIPAMPPTIRCTCPSSSGSARSWDAPACSTPATARWPRWRPAARSPPAAISTSRRCR